MAKDPQPTTTTTQQVLSPEQQELLGLAMPGFRDFAANPPQQYSGPRTAGFDPSQTAGQEMALSAAGNQNQIASDATAANKNILMNALDVNNNPALKGYMDAAARPITQQLTESTLPAVRGEAVSTGNFGSSRQGIAEGLASGRASQAVGDATSRIASDAYGKGLDATLAAIGQAPTLQQAQTAGAATTSGVGDIRQQLQQALMNDQISSFNYEQMLPFLMSSELAGVASGIPGGGAVSTGTNTSSSGGLKGGLGGAATGASIGSAFLPGIGTAVGGGLGGLLGFLS